jgi:Zn-dependent peptidase ImmA (M78 family)
MNNIAEEANKILQNNFIGQPPVPVFDIAQKNGLTVSIVAFPASISHIRGFITKEADAYIMYVNANDSEAERNFTIAHELGHWKLHKGELEKDLNKSILFRISIAELNKDKLEQEANLFASALLIPDNLYYAYKDDLDQRGLAEKFNVPDDVIGYRLQLIQQESAVSSDLVSQEKENNNR